MAANGVTITNDALFGGDEKIEGDGTDMTTNLIDGYLTDITLDAGDADGKRCTLTGT